MASLTTKQLVEVIQKSRLVEVDALKSALQRLKKQHGGKFPRDSGPLGKILLDERLVTEWQYEKLRAGKHRGFFLGKYRLLSHLGSGGMSSVYLADHDLMNRQVAVKVLPPSRVKEKSYLERFYLEAKAVAALDHPNIVRAYDVDSDGETHYLVMEFVLGSDLSRIVADAERLPPFAAVADYTIQAARGLEHAHGAGFIHRDVKPANLLVDQNGTVKLLDLGLALFKSDESSLTKDHDIKVMGTADYLAPEQAIDSHEVDARVDIYGLGCTLYFLLAGRPPFHEGTLAQRIAAHQSTEPPRVRELRPDCPEQLAEICHRMIAKDPDSRFPTATAVAEALDAWRRKSKMHLPVDDAVPAIITGESNGVSAIPIESMATERSSIEAIRVAAEDHTQPLAKRKRRRSGAKKPPLALWVVLALLTVAAISLLAYVLLR